MARPERRPAGSFDRHVGARISVRRTAKGLSQADLAAALGMTLQQVQDYESGLARMDAATLFDLSGILDAPIAFFFDGLPEPRRGAPPTASQGVSFGFAEAQARFGNGDTDTEREALDLLRAYFNIPDPTARRRVREQIRAMGFAEAADMGILLPGPATPVSDGSAAGGSTVEDEASLAEALAASRARGAALKQNLLTRPDMLSASQFAALLGTSAQGIRLKRQRHEVLGIELARRATRYPQWQVLPDQRLLPGLPRLFAIRGDDPWRMMRFLQQHHGETGGLRAVDALRRGDMAGVLAAAENTAAGAYS